MNDRCKNEGTVCRVVGCERDAVVRNWCRMHYRRVLRAGVPGEAAPRVFREPRDALCTERGCNNPHDARGWCKKHYKKYWMGG